MKNGMVHHNGYVAGWLDASIPDFLAMLPSTSDSTAFALITCLDSDLAPASVLKKNINVQRALNGAKSIKNGLVVPTKFLQKSNVRDQLFFGFDEVWFFPHDDIEPKPESTWIVGPNRIDQTKLNDLGLWMANNDCSMALGDGEGLNVIVKAHGLLKCFLAQSLHQPKPAFHLDRRWVQDEEKESLRPAEFPSTAKRKIVFRE